MYFVASCRHHFRDFFVNKSVLEIGSLNVNGSTRQYFSGCRYLGIDVGPGPGVDLVASGSSFRGDTDGYDVIISCECLEHDPGWQGTVLNAKRMLKKSGLLIITCAHLGRQQHGTLLFSPASSPHTAFSNESSYYRNLSENDFHEIADFSTGFAWCRFFVDYVSRDLYFAGLGTADSETIRRAEHFAKAVEQHLLLRNVEGVWR